VSFASIGAVWLEHTVITEYLDRATSVLIRLNLLLLMVVSFLPFPTRLLGEHIGADEPERVAVTIYGLNLFLASALVSLLWRYAVREQLIRPDLADADVRMLTKRLTPGLAGYIAMIALGLFRRCWPCSATWPSRCASSCPSVRSGAGLPRRDLDARVAQADAPWATPAYCAASCSAFSSSWRAGLRSKITFLTVPVKRYGALSL
jgi:Endosomal/lysosomal potassium channel TMEM175